MALNVCAFGAISRRFKPHLLMLLVQMGYTLLFFVTEASFNNGMNPHVYVTYRVTIGGLVVLPFAYFLERKQRPKLTLALLLEIIVLSLLGTSLPLNMYFAGLRYTSPTFIASVINTVASLTFVSAVILRLEVVDVQTPRGIAKILGTILSLAGVMIMTLYKGPVIKSMWASLIHISRSTVQENWLKGSILTIASAISWSISYLMQVCLFMCYINMKLHDSSMLKLAKLYGGSQKLLIN
ncbi:hypothetical protein L1049_003726 [Liquidambar formosana]|uniref:WAT1-related protein n=1 Tax=Liquidambar formosana TaxID=63359 RepID=A0AAP0RM47_LIQFO